MDVKRCGFLSHTPTRFKFGWDEEAVLCIKLKHVLLQQIQLLRQRGFPVHPIPTASITIPAAANAAAGIEYSATIPGRQGL